VITWARSLFFYSPHLRIALIESLFTQSFRSRGYAATPFEVAAHFNDCQIQSEVEIMNIIPEFFGAWQQTLTRTPLTTLTIYPRIVVDMGSKEQSEVRTTFETELQGLGELLHRFQRRFRIQLSLQPRIDGSALVNPYDSSIVVADGVKERRSIREDKIAAGNEQEARLYGLAAFLDTVRGHAAPRDDIDYDQAGLNEIGRTFLAIQKDGAVVSSVGPNSLIELKNSTEQLWAVDPVFWATLH